MKQKPAKKKKAAKRAPKPKPQPPTPPPDPPVPAAPAAAPEPPIAEEIRREQAAKPLNLTAERMAARKQAFLAAYGICGSVRLAARASGIGRRTHYDWLRKDSAYQDQFTREVRPEAHQFLEDEATERATIGVYEPNVFQGRYVYPQEQIEIEPAVRDRAGRIISPAKTEWRDVPGSAPLGQWKKSDYLLGMMLRGAMPEKYGRSALEVTGPGGGAIEVVQQLQAARRRAAQHAGQMAGESDAR